ncbi:MAG: NAD(P)/FAD-dependent oxidoreductase [Lachnospiraceae bacterium]|nr:NAD(P)/FAD-dependent oxidoreductase [Lachnospiraceae bacterium]
MKKVTVIGGGPAGMMAAISAAANGADVTLLEKNEKLGKKLYITGKGRCNLTNACDIEDIFENIVTNRKFMYSAIYSFPNTETVSFFEKRGLKLKEERGKRIFPASDKSSDVIKTLEKALKEEGVKVRLNTKVTDLEKLDCDAVIIATGGLSYPTTGSTGDGYEFAKQLGHKITDTVPALVPLVVEEEYAGRMEGLSLKNVEVRILNEKGRELHSDFGEMLFTAHGVSGPVILSASSKAVSKLGDKPGSLKLVIDLKPALDEKQLDARILRDFSENLNRNFKNSLNRLLPSGMIPVIVELSGIDGNKKVNEITKQERENLVRQIKNLTFTLTGSEGFSHAVITQGGVSVKDINPSTMESKLRPGVYFAGEVLDVDAFTGGFNIQIALSTGWLAGQSAAVSDSDMHVKEKK